MGFRKHPPGRIHLVRKGQYGGSLGSRLLETAESGAPGDGIRSDQISRSVVSDGGGINLSKWP